MLVGVAIVMNCLQQHRAPRNRSVLAVTLHRIPAQNVDLDPLARFQIEVVRGQ
jgi:hypothetical protein